LVFNAGFISPVAENLSLNRQDAVLAFVGLTHAFSNIPLLGFALFVGHFANTPRPLGLALFNLEKLEVRTAFVGHLESYRLDANIAESLKRFAELCGLLKARSA
jgi:hypothetical protein